ncbi:Transposase DDE domain protein [Alienimonas californiensis]|uniref:Transposase DDE domain protein n=2 Tax=Alienimonas californiensis TaxID=2527989 RepID=A0A517P6R6_9PLAN|nr:Transposase DDE domain protein [Alienimonas californiensis]
MRGQADRQPKMFFSIDLESRIRPDHPLRPLKKRVDAILAGLNERFSAAYSRTGRPGVPPERLLKALLLMAIYSVRSERQLVERIDTDLLFRWFLDMDPAEDAFDATAFTHNRTRLEEHGLAAAFFEAVVSEAIAAGLCSDDHFSVDGTMIESMASTKSFRPIGSVDDDQNEQDGAGFKSRNAEVDFHGRKRTNATHRSRTDPEARLYCKGPGKPALLAHLGHSLAENRNGLIMEVAVTEANGTAESEATIELLDRYRRKRGRSPKTLGADKGYDSGPLLLKLESRRIVPHVAMRDAEPADPKTARSDRREKIEARLRMKARLATAEYAVSQRVRKKVEEGFGWLKTIAGLGRSRHVGRWKLRQQLELSAAAYNLIRIQKLRPT